MFSCISNLVWGTQEEETDTSNTLEDTCEVEHSTHEEDGEWLVITTDAELTGEPTKSESTSQESECDHESVCSDGSWIITPAPTFRVTTTDSTTHPLENLLIEHPTMSVYGHVERDSRDHVDSFRDEEDRLRQEERERQRAQAQEREVVLLRNRERYQMSVQLQIPLSHRKIEQSSIKTEKNPLRVTRKATRRHNNIKQRTGRGKQNLTIKKCSFVAGRRRC